MGSHYETMSLIHGHRNPSLRSRDTPPARSFSLYHHRLFLYSSWHSPVVPWCHLSPRFHVRLYRSLSQCKAAMYSFAEAECPLSLVTTRLPYRRSDPWPYLPAQHPVSDFIHPLTHLIDPSYFAACGSRRRTARLTVLIFRNIFRRLGWMHRSPCSPSSPHLPVSSKYSIHDIEYSSMHSSKYSSKCASDP